MTTSAEWEFPPTTDAAVDAYLDRLEDTVESKNFHKLFTTQFSTVLAEKSAMATKEHIDQIGISVAPDGSIIVRYIDGDGQKAAMNLTAIIEQAADEAVKAHVRHLHGHSL